MAMQNTYDTSVMDLDQCLLENKNRHRSPIIHLPEIFMYGYEYKDVLECANNFKSCALDKSDDPVVNTVNYYSQKYANKIKPDALNTILDIIYENAYSIFHIGKDGTNYLASMKDGNQDICIDSVCLQWKELPDNAYDVKLLWDKINKKLSYDDFAKRMFDLFHSDEYVMNKGLKNILNMDQDVNDNFNRMPSYSYAIEDTSEIYDLEMNEIEALDHEKNNEIVLSKATEAPEDESDGLSDLENMTNPKKPTKQKRQRSADPISDLENMSGGNDDSQKAPTTNDNTEDGQVVDIAKMTNDRMTEDGGQTSEQLAEGEDLDAPAQDEENPDETGDEPTDDTEGDMNPDEGLDDTPEEDNTDEEQSDAELLNNPESKEVYRKRFIALYKHINDVIETLERFTPAYNVKCTGDYYNIQNDMYRLRTAIYKICTDRIKDMQTVDVMNAYLTANYAYDSIGELLKEFFRRYRTERGQMKISKHFKTEA